MPSRIEVIEDSEERLVQTRHGGQVGFLSVELEDGTYASLIVDCAPDDSLTTMLVSRDLVEEPTEADMDSRAFLKPEDELIVLCLGEKATFYVGPTAPGEDSSLQVTVSHVGQRAVESMFHHVFGP